MTLKKYKLEIIQNNTIVKASLPVLFDFEIMANDPEDAKKRYYLAASQCNLNSFVLDVKEITLNRPELAIRRKRKSPLEVYRQKQKA